MPTDIAKLFSSLGLSDTETKVYLASFKLGANSIQEIAKKAGLSRTATYDAVSTLQDKGLMSTVTRGKKKYFSAEEPERAVHHFQERLRSMKENLGTLSAVLPELKLQAGGERPTVRFYEGKDAIFAVFADMASVHIDSFDEISNFEDIYKYLDINMLHEAQRLADPTKMRIRQLHRGKMMREKRASVEYCELKPEFGDFHGDILIYANRVTFVSFISKPMTVIVEDKNFSDTARTLFNVAWQVCHVKE